MSQKKILQFGDYSDRLCSYQTEKKRPSLAAQRPMAPTQESFSKNPSLPAEFNSYGALLNETLESKSYQVTPTPFNPQEMSKPGLGTRLFNRGHMEKYDQWWDLEHEHFLDVRREENAIEMDGLKHIRNANRLKLNTQLTALTAMADVFIAGLDQWRYSSIQAMLRDQIRSLKNFFLQDMDEAQKLFELGYEVVGNQMAARAQSIYLNGVSQMDERIQEEFDNSMLRDARKRLASILKDSL